ncbi:MAG: hypothetical protein ACE5E9_14495 [Nitrospinaceae bacterium]
MKKTEFILQWAAGLWLLSVSATAAGSDILVRLTGDPQYPGILTLQVPGNRIDRVCFLGPDAKGNLDAGFLAALAKKGVPEGEYAVSGTLPGENWPVQRFSPNGALRFVPLSPEAKNPWQGSGKNGLAVHGRDFFPLAEGMTNNPKMVRFISDRLFEDLSHAWGTLRISNWDMGRLHDFFSRAHIGPEEWKVEVVAADPEEIKTICEPLKVQRRLGHPPE